MNKNRKLNLYQKIAREIEDNHAFLVCTHINPEGDAIGSMLALVLVLERLGKSVYSFSRDSLPQNLFFLPGREKINFKLKAGQPFDVVFVLDSGEIERIGSAVAWIKRHPKIINIDHHATNNKFGFLNLVEAEASSTGEILFRMFQALKMEISKEMADNLYCALVTDTGFFRYPNTAASTLKIAGELITLGAQAGWIAEKINVLPLPRLALLSRVLNSLEVVLDGKVAWITLRQVDLKETQATKDLAEDFIDYPKSILGVKVALFFKETGRDKFHVSFRSKGNVDVAKICKTFGGGGHLAAAACDVSGSLSHAKKQVLAEIKKTLTEELRREAEAVHCRNEKRKKS